MRANAKRIDTLNLALKSALSAINQSWPRYRILDNWGYKQRAKT
jgi:bacterioferritin